MTQYAPLTDEQKSTICGALSLGATYEVAANVSRCAEQAIYAQELRDQEFALRAAHSRLRSEIKLLELVHKAAEDAKQWRAAAWMLERLYPDRYAKRKPQTISPSLQRGLLRQTAEVILAELPKELQERLREQLDVIVASACTSADPVVHDQCHANSSDARRPQGSSRRKRTNGVDRDPAAPTNAELQ